ncbi:bifunctional proline dehydrogenase/L-glutamate gamma-semialdehyde dehydrogenase PutA [Oceaniserpentilla sp. 4NH20-0058]|uniref:bifunctional proline dehydrogenase/L-glutamate gamma-semialdehyde dehydrogenase PutA n=1 Tax=Oceaniserpentilla sp. 4NH20-0058 TaxID=3127660 RepID=UPI0031048B1B
MMDFTLKPANLSAEKAPHLKANIQQFYLCDEQDYVQDLLEQFPETHDENFTSSVENIINVIRQQTNQSILHQLLQEYDLSTDEGITLMCLAEALIRVPDLATANDLLIDKLSERGWQHHLNKSDSFWVNAASWGLALSGKMLKPNKAHPSEAIRGLVNKLTLKITHDAVSHAIRIMGEQFIFAQSIEDAVDSAHLLESKKQCCSFDMLGEQALSEDDALRYYDSYSHAIDVVAKGNEHKKQLTDNISIKLSALHPRYEPQQQKKFVPVIIERLLSLAKKAKALNVPITIDAEEQYRLDISLEIFESVLCHQDLARWGGFGIVIQAYGKRALSLLHWLYALADKIQTPIPVRLVKGAYWDSEIKWAQQLGLKEYPVFTQKASTDLNYLICAQFLLSEKQEWLKPKFATHNAWTVEYIINLNSSIPFEFQRLQGMGQALYEHVLEKHGIPCRIYAPIGLHQELLPYLVRRLIENGANSSFVFKVHDPQTPMHSLTLHPADYLIQSSIMNPNVPLPGEIFVDYRNSLGIELQHDRYYYNTMDAVIPYFEEHYETCPIINGKEFKDTPCTETLSPIDSKKIGDFYGADSHVIEHCCEYLKQNLYTPPKIEIQTNQVDSIADELHNHRHELIFLCMQEAGKTLQNAVDEVREAIDFCRYYARQAQKNLADPTILDSVTGEENLLQYRPRGTVLCISPWNFPLAIFVGQIVAALACGNRVVAKPARQTSITAHRAIELMFKAGINKEQLLFMPGSGAEITEQLIQQQLIDMVCFTGSTAAAKKIQLWLLNYSNSFIPLLAETGGQNVMLADSTALIDQLVPDVIESAFDSAGQRCSALRILYIQNDIKDAFYSALKGRMDVHFVESPFLRDTDIGPIIDKHEKNKLVNHIQWLDKNAKFIASIPLPENLPSDNFLAPCAYELNDIEQLPEEHFGPILHIIPFDHDDLDNIINQINQSGYGLTLGIHSRNQRWIDYICSKAIVGNLYINRNMIGAKVGSQPFGGHGLSGTGPKAGGPNYVHAFVKEFTLTTNTAAFGGNQELLS